jgi:dephospho-CoA kinase
MGKSTAAKISCRLGVPVSDADAIVRGLISPGGVTVTAVERSFPGSVENSEVNRVKLSAKVHGNPAAFKRNRLMRNGIV